MSHEITESLGDFNTQWIFAQYEAGKAVSEIAAGMKVCESAVYARMRMRPKTYEEVKKVREEMYCRRLRRVRLDEGKATENIGNASGDLLVWKTSPFQMRTALDARECPFSKRRASEARRMKLEKVLRCFEFIRQEIRLPEC